MNEIGYVKAFSELSKNHLSNDRPYYKKVGDQMPNIDVKCSVSNCFFYKSGNNCGAPAIMVEIDQHSFPKEEFADELGIQNQHIDTAGTSRNTCCRTFRPTESKV